jgi:hypothetical protein
MGVSREERSKRTGSEVMQTVYVGNNPLPHKLRDR